MERVFAADAAARVGSDSVQRGLAAAADGSVGASATHRKFNRYLLPEPTLRRDNVQTALGWLAARPERTYFLYFDALPLTHPQFYPRGADSDGAVTRYHRVVARATNVAFISGGTRSVFERRLGRRPVANGLVARPGADALPHVPPQRPERPSFTVLGTVEPRKRHRVVLEAFESLWSVGREYDLVLLGGWGWEEPDLRDRLRQLQATGNVRWIVNAGDETVAATLARSTAVVFTPSAEGYGLPVVEALAAGCPVITSAGLPVLEGLPEAGQIRLESPDAASLAAAVTTLADADTNEEYRAAIPRIELPTWTQFANEVATWMSRDGPRRSRR